MDRFEAELRGLRPRTPSPELIDRIGARLTDPTARPSSDRFLLSAMSAGAIAACVIVILLLAQTRGPFPSAASMNATKDIPRLGDSLQAFARADVEEAGASH
jgi:allophanate hydrolase subunit 2